MDDETRLSPGAADVAVGSGPTVGSTSGWLSSSGAIDHGRFPPGTLLGGRYRIVGRLGRGGMGEVYRADDLKLGQAVALKFLPPEVDRDPARLMQLHTEVRIARQVSHPNVCRVYDIDEVDGHTFLSMEYVDGEDLSSLVRRIGRFSIDRALELARQLCAGLAAAHDRGVIHRDLKPANVMIDGTGRVRITDFGLAGLTGESIAAGTPAYMAPEQLAGGEVTARSDVYSLGLVLYEIFTGQRALEGKTIAELVRNREEGGVRPPSELVRDLDPSIDRAIARCLERDPMARPASALAVAAALPGGDPLAAALAAGETPSPEMVAAAGGSSALGALPAISALIATLAFLFVVAALGDRSSLASLGPPGKMPAVLADRAEQIARELGYTEAFADWDFGFATASEYLTYASTHPEALDRSRLGTGRPPLLVYWHRTSPRPLVPSGGNSSVSYNDPPHVIAGMVAMQLDTEGRLLELIAVPPQLEGAPEGATGTTPAWPSLFAAAGLDMTQFTPVTPQWTPRTYSDSRAAWEGPMPGWPEVTLRLEAAAYRGRPVHFQSIGPWTRPTRMASAPESATPRWFQTIATAIFLSVLVGAVVVARHNLRKGRGDRRGARLLGAGVLATGLVAWAFSAKHVAALNVALGRWFEGISFALFLSAMIWILYIALEPYVRRFWPATLISWSRLLSGQWRDPQVGRDVLIGCLLAVAIEALDRSSYLLLPILGYPAQPNSSIRTSDLEGMRELVSSAGNVVFNALFNALWCIFGLVVLRLIFRRIYVTILVTFVVFLMATSTGLGSSGPWWLSMAVGAVALSLVLTLMLRLGLLATSAFFLVNFLVGGAPLTLNPGRWFFSTSAVTLAAAAVLAFYGFYASRGGEPLLGRRILD